MKQRLWKEEEREWKKTNVASVQVKQCSTRKSTQRNTGGWMNEEELEWGQKTKRPSQDVSFLSLRQIRCFSFFFNRWWKAKKERKSTDTPWSNKTKRTNKRNGNKGAVLSKTVLGSRWSRTFFVLSPLCLLLFWRSSVCVVESTVGEMLLFGSACFWMLGSLDREHKLVRPRGMEVFPSKTKPIHARRWLITQWQWNKGRKKEGGQGWERPWTGSRAGHKATTTTTATWISNTTR